MKTQLSTNNISKLQNITTFEQMCSVNIKSWKTHTSSCFFIGE